MSANAQSDLCVTSGVDDRSVGQELLPWYALHVRPNTEDLTCAALSGKGYEYFNPKYSVSRRRTDSIKKLQVPLFPGYLFCRLDIQKRLPVLTTPSVVSIIGCGNTPTSVPAFEIDAIRRLVDAQMCIEPHAYLTIGTIVRIDHGPLAGVEGIVAEVRNKRRIIVSISLLCRSVAAEIDSDLIRTL
jgi:transcription antitermination factor NusG